jgi:predicted nucleotidyltransferase
MGFRPIFLPCISFLAHDYANIRLQDLTPFLDPNDFRPDSDVDVLVTFSPGSDWGVEHLLDMKEELEALFGRTVDLVEKRLVEESRNYIRRKHILSHMEAVYAA